MKRWALVSVVFASSAMSQTPPPIVRTPPPVFTPTPVPAARQLALPSIPDNEATMQWSRSGNWLIRIDKTVEYGCFAFASFDDRTQVRLAVMPSEQGFAVHVGSPFWRSLRPEETYLIEIDFDNRPAWSGDARVITFQPLKFLVLRVSDPEFMLEAAKSNAMTVRWAGKFLTRLEMRGADKAILAVVDCQKAVEGVVDPFSKQESLGPDPFKK